MKIPIAEGITNIEQNVLTYTKPNDTENRGQFVVYQPKTGWIKLPGGPTGKFQVNTLITFSMIHSPDLWNQISKQLFSHFQASNYQTHLENFPKINNSKVKFQTL